jgi:anti-sigma B factor antagonist
MYIKLDQLSPVEAVLLPVGRLDVESAPLVRQAILDLVEKGITALVLDLSHVEFVDSSGLSVFVSGMKALRRSGGRLAICNANPQVHTALRLTMLEQIFPNHASAEDAFHWLESSPIE